MAKIASGLSFDHGQHRRAALRRDAVWPLQLSRHQRRSSCPLEHRFPVAVPLADVNREECRAPLACRADKGRHMKTSLQNLSMKESICKKFTVRSAFECAIDTLGTNSLRKKTYVIAS